MSQTRKILVSSVIYSAIQYVVLALGFVKGIYQAKYLGPALLGTYGLISLILEYTNFTSLGVFSAMNLEVSIHIGKPEKDLYIKKVINNAFTYLIFMAAIFVLVTVGVRHWIPVAKDVQPYLYQICLVAIALHLKNFAIIFARLYERYHWINWIESITNVIMFVAIFMFIRDYRLDAVVMGMVLAAVFAIVFSVWLIVGKIQYSFDASLIKSLVVIGFPILLYTLCEKIFATIDRLIISNFLSREDLGYFTLSYTMITTTLVFLNSFSFLYYPKILHHFNRTDREDNTPQKIFESLQRYTNLQGCVAMTLGLIGMVVIEPFIHIFLPSYETSILLYQVLIFGIVFDMIAFFAVSYLVSNKHQISLIFVIVISSLVAIVANLISVKLGLGLLGICMATTLAFFFYGLAKFALVLHKIQSFSLGNLLAFYQKYFILAASAVTILILKPSLIFVVLIALPGVYFREYNVFYRGIRSGKWV